MEGGECHVRVCPQIVVEQEGGARRCGGSLVSLRTALTAAACAEPATEASPAQLWALAGACAARGLCARRVARVAAARGPAAVALLELHSPFGPEAHTRPILMATSPDE